MAQTTTQIIDQNLINQIAAIIAATQQTQAAQAGFPLGQGLGIPQFTPFPGAQQYLGAPAIAPDASKGFLDVLRQAGQLAMQYGQPVYNAVQQILSRGMQMELAGYGVQVPSQYGQMPISPVQTLTPEQQRALFDVLRQVGQLAMQYGQPVYNMAQNILSKGVQWQPIAPLYGWQGPIAVPQEVEEQAKFLSALAMLGSHAPGVAGAISALIRGMHPGMQPGAPSQATLWGVPFQQMR